MYKLIFVAALIWWHTAVAAQSVFNKLYTTDTSHIGFIAARQIGDQYLAFGSTYNINGSYVGFWLLDANGKIMSFNLLDYAKKNHSLYGKGQLLQLSDSVFIAAIDAKSSKQNYSDDIMVIKFDILGNILLKKVYEKQDNQTAHEIITTSDGGYLIAGWTQAINEIGYMYALKIDSIGGFVWENTYSLSNYGNSAAVSVVPAVGGDGYILSGYGYHKDKDYQAYLVKINHNGEKIEYKDFGGIEANGAGLLTVYQNLYFLIYGVHKAKQYYPVISLIDTSFNPVGPLKKYDNISEVAGYAIPIVKGMDNGYWLAGYSAKDNTANPAGMVMRFTANCDTVWVKTVQTSPSHDNYLRDVTPTSDGGCIAAGFKLYPSPQMGWLLKFDADGNICWQVNCDSTLTTTQVIPTISGNGLTLYPNPADHTLTVSTTNDLVGTYLEIYNSMGLLVWQQKLTANTITFATNHLANGAYFLRANNTTVKFTIIH
ncbi:MAG: T9SS type A sorting domain-containing protein [Sphingobacteriales bacterium]|jgi:hypothetical protein|nr:T9SS type A sorting domain-containing protein [Sphingobacteriales bacterium]MBP9141297.1 T9SS type A sorting domain-containing protein [Chitinophagales bacterium]MDA0198702.1 T9SS type A sorting domain-containing protein [Bacteroidota bacterium]MBK7528116.1 T9SS type A sorting domain-containing protein [Sphingobacteriales bacterium]MBK8679744.1 T9SS type A sorting domain-containing protein [Sphingobacteriales bacterium]